MLTKLKTAYEKLIHSKEFTNNGFLCGAFLMCNIEDLEKTEWQLDFYNKESDTITSYTIGDKIHKTENSEIFKKEDTTIKELNLEDIKTKFEDIKNKSEKILSKNHEEPIKITIIIQNQETPIWNLIYITKKFNLFYIKINAINGELIEEKIVPLLSFEKGDAKK